MLLLFYEDLHADLAAAVKLIADFTGVAAGDAEAQAIACRQASIEHMRQFPSKCAGLALPCGRRAVNGGRLRGRAEGTPAAGLPALQRQALPPASHVRPPPCTWLADTTSTRSSGP